MPLEQLPDSIGPYRLDERLGGGGMGEVYRGYDARLDRPVALKRVRPGVGDPETALRRFRREARAAAGLRHPAIVQVYDWVESGDGAWLVMELVEGRSLRAVLDAGPLAPDRAMSFARDLLEGLAVAHEAGLVHRDLKAGNVMVTRGSYAGRGSAEQARILDFGLAKKAHVDKESHLSVDGKIVGTLSAMAPEQLLGKAIDGRTDLFALGCLLYEALTGSHPFLGSSAGESVHRICNVFQPPVKELRPEVGDSLSAFVEALLQKDRRRRPSSAASALERLEQVSGVSGDFAGPDLGPPTWDGSGSEPGGDGEPVRGPEVGGGAVRDGSSQYGNSPHHGMSESGAAAATTNRSRQGMLWAGVLGILILGAVVLLWQPPTVDVEEPVFVAVPSTTRAVSGERNVELAAGAVHTTLLQGLVDLRGVIAVEVPDGAPRSTQDLVRELAADEVLFSGLDCDDRGCRVELRRIDAEGHVLWAHAFTAEPARLLDLSEAVLGYLGAAYPDAERRQGAVDLEVRPSDYESYLRLHQRFQRRDQGFSSAQLLDELEHLGASSPRFVAIPLLLAHAALQRVQETRAPQDAERATAALTRALDLAPQDPRVLMLAARAARQRDDLEAAQEYLRQLRQLEPGHAEADFQLALLSEQRGDFERAAALARSATERRPSAYLLFNSADLFYRQGNFTAARESIERGLERSPDRFNGLSRLAQLELAHGDLRRAAELYETLVERSPEATELTNLGTALMMLGRLDEARAYFAQALEQSPSSPFAALNLADVTKLLGHVEGAAELYARVLELTATEAQASSLASVRAQALAHLGRKEAAVEAVQLALRRRPDHPWVAFEAALVHTLIDDRASALWNARRALDGGIEPRWFTLGWFEPIRGELDAAIAARRAEDAEG